MRTKTPTRRTFATSISLSFHRHTYLESEINKDDLAEHVGRSFKVRVHDVATQKLCEPWSFDEWLDYFYGEKKHYSSTKLAGSLHPPEALKEIAWDNSLSQHIC